MAEYIIPVVMRLIGGVMSWVATNFVGHQVTRFYRLKGEFHSSLTLYANVSPVYERDNPREPPDWDRFIEAHGTLRRLASELRALASNHVLTARMLGCFGYRLIDAATDLFGFANTLASPDPRHWGELAWNRDTIERSLKFPLSYPTGVTIRDD